MPEIGKPTETESRLAIAWGGGELWAIGVIAEGCMISLGDKKYSKIGCGDGCTTCKYITHNLTVHFKWTAVWYVNCLNKAVIVYPPKKRIDTKVVEREDDEDHENFTLFIAISLQWEMYSFIIYNR